MKKKLKRLTLHSINQFYKSLKIKKKSISYKNNIKKEIERLGVSKLTKKQFNTALKDYRDVQKIEYLSS
jgi:hypothetical protein